jgi:pimeloyl-ACP methyl ester carboxylesterase
MRADAPEQWLLLRGLGRESAHWDDFPRLLARALPGVTMRLLDLPGSGRYWDRASPWSIGAMTEALRAEMDVAPNARRCYIVAMSLGGMVAVDWLSRYPQELSGAVLINSSLNGLCPFWERLRPGAWPALLRIAMTPCVRVREARIFRLTTRLAVLTDALLAGRVAIQRQRPFTRSNLLRQIVAAGRYKHSGSPPQVPLLVLNSADDRMVHPNCSQRLAQAWQVPLKTHPTANHDLPLDDPYWTITAITSWRSGLP